MWKDLLSGDAYFWIKYLKEKLEIKKLQQENSSIYCTMFYWFKPGNNGQDQTLSVELFKTDRSEAKI